MTLDAVRILFSAESNLAKRAGWQWEPSAAKDGVIRACQLIRAPFRFDRQSQAKS